MVENQTHSTEKTQKNALATPNFLLKYNKLITYISVSIILILGAFFLYKKWIVEPKENKAAEAIAKAEEYFRQDSLKLSLEGRAGEFIGFKDMIKKYSGTQAGNTAKLYAGICYLQLGDFNNAIKHLEDFETNAQQVQALAYAKLADAYSEVNKKDKAVEFYKKAANHFEKDEYNSSEYLFRAAQLLETIGKDKDAIELYQEIKTKYPKTEKGFQVDKYLARLGVL